MRRATTLLFVLMFLMLVACGNSERDRKSRSPGTAVKAVEPLSGSPDIAGADRASGPPAPPVGAARTESGIAMVVLQPPRRLRTPAAYDEVALRVTRWPEGDAADEAERRPVSELAPGLREVVQQMARGEKRRVWIPARLGGASGNGDEAGAESLRAFEIELLELFFGAPPPTPPSDLASPPPDASRTPSGVFYRLLAPAEAQGPRPRAGDDVELHVTTWRSDGELVDSTLQTGQPAMRALASFGPGLAEGLQRLREGDRARLWVPAELSADAAAVVVDVELLEVHRRAATRAR